MSETTNWSPERGRILLPSKQERLTNQWKEARMGEVDPKSSTRLNCGEEDRSSSSFLQLLKLSQESPRLYFEERGLPNKNDLLDVQSFKFPQDSWCNVSRRNEAPRSNRGVKSGFLKHYEDREGHFHTRCSTIFQTDITTITNEERRKKRITIDVQQHHDIKDNVKSTWKRTTRTNQINLQEERRGPHSTLQNMKT